MESTGLVHEHNHNQPSVVQNINCVVGLKPDPAMDESKISDEFGKCESESGKAGQSILVWRPISVTVMNQIESHLLLTLNLSLHKNLKEELYSINVAFIAETSGGQSPVLIFDAYDTCNCVGKGQHT